MVTYVITYLCNQNERKVVHNEMTYMQVCGHNDMEGTVRFQLLASAWASLLHAIATVADGFGAGVGDVASQCCEWCWCHTGS